MDLADGDLGHLGVESGEASGSLHRLGEETAQVQERVTGAQERWNKFRETLTRAQEVADTSQIHIHDIGVAAQNASDVTADAGALIAESVNAGPGPDMTADALQRVGLAATDMEIQLAAAAREVDHLKNVVQDAHRAASDLADGLGRLGRDGTDTGVRLSRLAEDTDKVRDKAAESKIGLDKLDDGLTEVSLHADDAARDIKKVGDAIDKDAVLTAAARHAVDEYDRALDRLSTAADAAQHEEGKVGTAADQSAMKLEAAKRAVDSYRHELDRLGLTATVTGEALKHGDGGGLAGDLKRRLEAGAAGGGGGGLLGTLGAELGDAGAAAAGGVSMTKMLGLGVGIPIAGSAIGALMGLGPAALFGGIDAISTMYKHSIDQAIAAKQQLTSMQQLALPVVNSITRAFASVKPAIHTFGVDILNAFHKATPAFQEAAKALGPMVTILGSSFGKIIDTFLPTMASLMQKSLPVVQAFATGLTGLFGDVGKMFAQLNFKDAATAMRDLFAAVGALPPLFTQLINALMPVGNALLETFTPVLTALAPIVHAAVPLFQLLGRIIAALTPIITALLPPITQLATAVLGALVAILEPLVPLISDMVKALTPVISVVAGVITVLAKVITLIGQFTGLLVQLATQAIGPVVAAIGTVLGILGRLVTEGLQKVVKWVDFLLTHFQDFATGARRVWNNVLHWVEGAINGIIGFFKAAPRWLVHAGESMITGLWHGIQDVWRTVTSFFRHMAGTVGGWLSSAASWLVSRGAEVITGLWHGVEAGWRTVAAFFTGLARTVVGWLSNAGKWLVSIGKDIIDGLWQGITGGVSWLGDKVRGVGHTIVGWFKDVFHINSPSRAMADEVGGPVITGLWSGISTQENWVMGQIAGFGNRVIATFQRLFRGDGDLGTILTTSLRDGITRGLPGVNSALHTLSNMLAATSSQMTAYQSSWMTTGQMLVEGMIQGMQSEEGSLQQTVADLANMASEAAQYQLQIGSPSRVAAEKIGKPFVQGIVMGIRENAGMLNDGGAALLGAVGGLGLGRLPVGGTSGQVVIDLRGAQVMSDRDMDAMVAKIGKAVSTSIAPGAGLRVQI